jgi:hypothetical protein
MTTLAVIKSEYEFHGMGRPEWNSLSKKPKNPALYMQWYNSIPRGQPGTIPLIPPLFQQNFVTITPQIKEFWKDLLRKSFPHPETGMSDAQYKFFIDKAYDGLTAPNRAFTNRDNTKLQNMVCVGATVELAGNKFHHFGQDLYPIKTINAKKFMPATYLAMPLSNPYVFFAVNSTKIIISEGRLEEKFPQLAGANVPVPLMSNTGIAYIPAKWIEKILPPDDNFIQCPYVPKLW